MHRSLLSTVFTLALVVPALPLSAQGITWDSAWTAQRPDAVAPAGVELDHTLDDGQLEFVYRLRHFAERGYINSEGDEVSRDALFNIFLFPLITEERWRQTHEISALYATNDRFTVQLTVPYVFTEADLVDFDGNRTTLETNGLGDPSLSLLMRLWSEDAVRLHASGGITLPVAGIKETEADRFLPYRMQLGSGTPDVTPGLTFTAMNGRGVFGAQALATFRLGDNNRGWNAGDETTARIWLAPRFSDYVSASLGLVWRAWENVIGLEQALSDDIPEAFEGNTGGNRWDLPVGLNIFFPEGALEGHRISAEMVFPISNDLDGPQLETDWGFVLSWRRMF